MKEAPKSISDVSINIENEEKNMNNIISKFKYFINNIKWFKFTLFEIIEEEFSKINLNQISKYILCYLMIFKKF